MSMRRLAVPPAGGDLFPTATGRQSRRKPLPKALPEVLPEVPTRLPPGATTTDSCRYPVEPSSWGQTTQKGFPQTVKDPCVR